MNDQKLPIREPKRITKFEIRNIGRNTNPVICSNENRLSWRLLRLFPPNIAKTKNYLERRGFPLLTSKTLYLDRFTGLGATTPKTDTQIHTSK